MNQGCVLAILRLLSHIYNQRNHQNGQKKLNLYRDLIFLQTEPLPSLSESLPKPLPKKLLNPQIPPKSLKPVLQLPNPFQNHLDLSNLKLTNHSPDLSYNQPQSAAADLDSQKNRLTSHLNNHPFSAGDAVNLDHRFNHSQQGMGLLPPSNPFRQRSASSNAAVGFNNSYGTASTSSESISPPLPPRPNHPYSSQRKQGTHSAEDAGANQIFLEESVCLLPPPKHYSHRVGGRSSDEPTSSNDLDFVPSQKHSSRSISPSQKFKSFEKSLVHKSSSCQVLAGAVGTESQTPEELKGIISDSSNLLPPIKPPRPPPAYISAVSSQVSLKVDSTTDKSAIETLSMKNLARAKSLNHSSQTNKPPPPVPPPRKRPESLQLHNPHSVPLDQFVTLGDDKVRNPYRLGKRTVSNTNMINKPIEGCRRQTRRRSVSLFQGHDDSNVSEPIKVHSPEANIHLRQLRTIEVGLMQDGKELVREVKEGWRSRHGRRDERKPLVGKPEKEVIFRNGKVRTSGGSVMQALRINARSISDEDIYEEEDKKVREKEQDGEEDSSEELHWHRLE
ncbi:hypothetical protein BY996DRAFT_2095526 [Phakopsora pachyrhizi]|nr:hypothetical protein BY996DRAFT_2095526 [Phakopsora pachyrhizi]